jgi:3-hydroxyacyl-CoA dehydrogenase
MDHVRRVAVLGSGTVGASWALYFLARGLEVAVYDTDPAREAFVRDYIERGWPTMRRLGEGLSQTPPAIVFRHSLQETIGGADYVQEAVPDVATIKRELFGRLDRSLPAHVIVGSSTSSLLMSELQAGLPTAERFVVAHPFNPPHLIPVVEVVGGRLTSSRALDATCAFFTRIGKTVLRMRKEIRGHLVNRLQAALFQEAVWLVQEGVADVADIDRGIAMGPGLRWAAAGPFLTFHLGADAGGIRSYLHHLGSAHERMWEDLQRVPTIRPEVAEQITAGVHAEVGSASVAELAARRDEALIALLNLMSSKRV